MTSDKEMWELAGAATESPWEATTYINDDTDGPWTSYGVGLEPYPHGHEVVTMNCVDQEDAAFIAAARSWVPDALDRLDEVRALHRSDEHATRPLCTECRRQWPCDTWDAVKVVDAALQP